MADDRTFVLVGKFDDQITKKLKVINEQLKLLAGFGKSKSKSPFNNMAAGIKAANEELKQLSKGIDSLSKKTFNFDKSGIRAAQQEVKVLSKEIDSVAQKGFQFDRSGIKAAQQEARVLGEILKANALIQAGQGVAAAGGAGIRGGLGAANKIVGFIYDRAKDAAKDQLEDVQARGSLFGALNKAELFSNAKNISDQKKLQAINESNYDTTRSISRSMEGSIADVVKSSTVATSTITTLSRQLSDNLLPSMLKAKGITDLSKFEGAGGRKELDKVMGGEKGVGKELATLYEQMGSIITGPQYAPQAAMGFTQFLGQGTINKQLSIFENNPVLVDAMKKYAAEFGNTTEGRIKALKKALEVAMPEAALQEARQTLMGGIQSVSDTLTNANAGILSMGADVAGQGQKTLEMARRTGAIQLQEKAFERRQSEVRKKWAAEKHRTDKEEKDRNVMEAEQRQKYSKGLKRLYENADSPMEIIAASFGPLLQKFADFLGSTRNLFIDPVMAIMERLQGPLAQLMDNLESLGSDVRNGDRTLANALGRFFAELFKAFATLFDPKGVAEQGGNAIQKAFQDFAEGFKELDGQKYLDIILKGIGDFLMKALFNEGDALKGVTPLGDALIKVFGLLAAPAFINSLITGLTPIVLMQMGSMVKGVFGKVTKSVIASKGAKAAAANAAKVAADRAALTRSLGMNAAYMGGEAAAAAAPVEGAAAVGGLAAVPVWGWIAALAASVVIFEKPIMAFTNMLQSIGEKMQTSSNWVTSSFGQVVQGIGQLFGGITKFFNGLWEVVSGLLMGDTDRVKNGIKKLFQGIADAFVGIGRTVGGLGGMIVGAITNLFKTIADLIARGGKEGKPNQRLNPLTGKLEYSEGQKAVLGGKNVVWDGTKWVQAQAKGSAHPFMSSLGPAISYEMANKPSGSNLVVANSSETIIPAAGGLGMSDFMATLNRGFNQITALVAETSKQAKDRDTKQDASLLAMQQQLTKMGTLGMGGAMFGSGGPNSVISVGKQLLGMGLQVGMNPFFQYGRGFLPGGGGYIGQHSPNSLHYSGRAIDVSGPPGLLDQAYAGLRGTNPTELLWRVPGHFDHLHVAYGMGAGAPAFFNSQAAAQQWERSMAPRNSSIASVTSNSGEFGGGATINAPITINALPGQDETDIANAVLDELERRVSRVRTSSLFFS